MLHQLAIFNLLNFLTGPGHLPFLETFDHLFCVYQNEFAIGQAWLYWQRLSLWAQAGQVLKKTYNF